MKLYIAFMFVAIVWAASQPPHVAPPPPMPVSCDPLAVAQNDFQVVAKFPCKVDMAERYKVMDWETYYGYYPGSRY